MQVLVDSPWLSKYIAPNDSFFVIFYYFLIERQSGTHTVQAIMNEECWKIRLTIWLRSINVIDKWGREKKRT